MWGGGGGQGVGSLVVLDRLKGLYLHPQPPTTMLQKKGGGGGGEVSVGLTSLSQAHIHHPCPSFLLPLLASHLFSLFFQSLPLHSPLFLSILCLLNINKQGKYPSPAKQTNREDCRVVLYGPLLKVKYILIQPAWKTKHSPKPNPLSAPQPLPLLLLSLLSVYLLDRP